MSVTRHSLLAGWAVLFFSVAAQPASAQAIIYVDASAAGSQDGSSWLNAYVHLQDALSAAESSQGAISEIRVATGVYRPDLGLGQTAGDRHATFRLVNGVALVGGYAGSGAADPDERDVAAYETILSGDLLSDDAPDFVNRSDNSFHVVTNDDPTTTLTTILDGFTIRAGYANGTLAERTDQGAGVHNFNGVNPFTGRMLMRNCTLTDNWAANHGAFNDHGGATIESCAFVDNVAVGWGGGLYVHGGLTATVSDSSFIGNHSDGTLGGGGAVANEGVTTFTNCRFEGNTTLTHGGAVYNHGGAEPTFTDCVFEGNTIDNPGAFIGGSAVYSLDSRPRFDRCTFLDNAVYGDSRARGGAVYDDNSPAHFSDCVFEGNYADWYAGAVYTVESDTTFSRCTFQDNVAFEAAGAALNLDSEILIEDSEFRRNTVLADTLGNGYAGAVYSSGSPTTIVRSQFADNYARNISAVYLDYRAAVEHVVLNSLFVGNTSIDLGPITMGLGALRMSNCTIYGNRSDAYGAGVSWAAGSATVYLGNNILWGNISSQEAILEDGQLQVNCGDEVPCKQINIGSNNCIEGWSGSYQGEGNIDVDPMFVDPDGADDVLGTQDDDFRLMPDSPLIDAGHNGFACALTDLAGNPRRLDDPATPDTGNGDVALVDIGAFEFVPDDCNDNGVPDTDDIALGVSDDANDNGVPDECEVDTSVTAPLPEPNPVAKVRYLSIAPGNPGKVSAIRVTLDELPSYASFDGAERWVGPVASIIDPSSGETLHTAALQCAAHYDDWGAYPVVHVYGAEVVPASTYRVSIIHESCIPFEGIETSFSADLSVHTGVWGDVAEPLGGPNEPSFVDITAILSAFRESPGSISKVQAQLQPNVPNPAGLVSFADISASVDAFKGLPYPFAGPSLCP